MPNANESDLETLFQQAEAEASPKQDQPAAVEQPQTTIEDCDHAGSDIHSRRFCRHCKQMICQFCWSVIDSNYCQACMRSADLKVEESTITDDEGVTHHGRLIHPLGQFNDLRWIPNGKTTAKALSEMSMPELEEYVSAYKQAVYEAERAVDIRRIKLSSGLMELDERRAQERRRLRQDKTKYPVRNVTLDPKTGKRATSKQATQAQAASAIDLLKMFQALQNAMKAKEPNKP